MVETIESEVSYTFDYTGVAKLSEPVVQALREVPRHEFVRPGLQAFAYDNSPLYIGRGQTISQPYIVAIMTELIAPKPEHRVLDIGTGSGYQAAILAKLVKHVYSVEIIDELANEAIERFKTLSLQNIDVKIGDGNLGWAEQAPYDGIVVAATTPSIPMALIDQLKPGGKMIIPVGHATLSQELVLIEKNQQGVISSRNILPVAFVPLVGEQVATKE